MSLFLRFLFLFLFCGRLHAAEYELTTDTFQLGRWNPKTLSYGQGLKKIEALDNWYEGLPADQKSASRKAYALNRNRLFLVTQEKRLRAELDKPVSLQELAKDQIQPSWIAAGRNVLMEKKRKKYFESRDLNQAVLGDEKVLSNRLLRSVEEIEKFGFKRADGSKIHVSFGRSMSKSGGGGSGMESMMSSRSIFEGAMDPEKACQKGDKTCHERVAAHNRLILDQTGFSWGTQGTVDRVGENSRPACRKSEASGPAPDSSEFAAFKKKRDAFLEKVGSQNWKPKRTENDLSRWYSEPVSQWDPRYSEPNAKCVGHAISSDIAAVVNKDSIINYQISGDATYAQTHVITREELERRAREGTIAPEEREILSTFSNVKSINSKHAEFCNSSFYNVDDYMGTVQIDNSLNHVFKAFQNKPLCGSKANASKDRKADVPLFTVDRFEAMEFEDPSKQALDYDFFRQMIDTGNPPIVMIDSDARYEDESSEWLYIKPRGRLKHVLNVVGYGEEIDSQTLCKVRYLKVRDSLGEKQVHFKIPADNLIGHVMGVYKVTSVKKTD